MLLVPILQKDGQLFLDAYSYADKELEAVAQVLHKSGIPFEREILAEDKAGRKGLRYIVEDKYVQRLAQYLSVEFQGVYERTTTTLHFLGAGYRCQEIELNGHGKGCVDLTARDQLEATMKCALIANNKGWLGGVATPGSCKGR